MVLFTVGLAEPHLWLNLFYLIIVGEIEWGVGCKNVKSNEGGLMWKKMRGRGGGGKVINFPLKGWFLV